MQVSSIGPGSTQLSTAPALPAAAIPTDTGPPAAPAPPPPQAPQTENRFAQIQTLLDAKQPVQALELATQVLQSAESGKDMATIASSLSYIATAQLHQKNCEQAALIYASAIKLVETHFPTNTVQIKALQAKLLGVEKRFLIESCGIDSQKVEAGYATLDVANRRQRLDAIRKSAATQMQASTSIREILSRNARDFKALDAKLLQECFSVLGNPPCAYAFGGLGSLPQNLPLPYSDLESFFCLASDDESAKEYFRKVTKLLMLMIIGLGETPFPILNKGLESPIVEGFCMDKGGNTPLGKVGLIELIGTPTFLVQTQNPSFFEGDLILSFVMTCVSLVAGSSDLIKTYEAAVKTALDVPSTSAAGLTVRQERALYLLTGFLHEFEPDPAKKPNTWQCVHAKKDLSRLPTMSLAALALFFGVDMSKKSPWERLEALQSYFHPRAIERLQHLLEHAYRFRQKVHLHHQGQEEFLFYPKEMQDAVHDDVFLHQQYVLSNDEVNVLFELFKILMPLHRTLKEFCRTKDPAVLRQSPLYDEDPGSIGEGFERMGNLQQAIQWYKKALGLDAKNGHVQLRLGRLLLNAMNALDDALKVAQEALTVGENSPLYPEILELIGSIHARKGSLQEATLYLEQAIEKGRLLYGEEDLQHFPRLLTQLASIYGKLNQKDRSAWCLDYTARLCQTPKPGTEFARYTALRLLGTAYKELGYGNKAVEALEGALKLVGQQTGEMSPEQLDIYVSLADLYMSVLQQPHKAIVMLERILPLARRSPLIGKVHLSRCFLQLGRGHQVAKQNEKALLYLDLALQGAFEEGEKHPYILKEMKNIAITMIPAEPQRGADLLEKVVKNALQHLPLDHLDRKEILTDAIAAFLRAHEIERTRRLIREECLGIKMQHGENSVRYLQEFDRWAKCFFEQTTSNRAKGEAILYAKGFQEVTLAIYGEKSLEFAASEVRLAHAYYLNEQGFSHEEILFYLRHMKVARQIYGDLNAIDELQKVYEELDSSKAENGLNPIGLAIFFSICCFPCGLLCIPLGIYEYKRAQETKARSERVLDEKSYQQRHDEGLLSDILSDREYTSTTHTTWIA